jgi:hypothetical protein
MIQSKGEDWMRKLLIVAGASALLAGCGEEAPVANEPEAAASLEPGQYQAEWKVASLRIVDKNNGPSETATAQDTPFRVTVPCTTTSNTSIGSSCSVNTTADAVAGAGAIQEGKRALWQLGQVRVNDGGADGVASTTPNSPFMVQGVMVP